MKKKILILLFFSFLGLNLFAQIDDLKDKAEENKNNSGTTNDVPSFISPSNGYLLGTCLRTAYNLVFSVVGQAVINHHLFVMSSIPDQSKLSVEVSPTLAYGSHYNHEEGQFYDYIDVLPQIHGRWGAFSTDLRYNLLTDIQDFSVDAFKSWQWNFLINIQPTANHLITFGTGINMEVYSKKPYNEHFIGYTYKSVNMIYEGYLNGRFATNYNFGIANPKDAVFYTEVNLGARFKFLTYNNLFGYLKAGIIYQNYFLNHSIYLAQLGVSFNIH